MQTTTKAPDIVCDGCANAIKKALSKLPGVTEVEVAVPTKQVTVSHDASVSSDAIRDALDRAGFPTS
jgi:copper chaperone CopZ